jgi:uracil phosphoribosyltransferase
MTDNIFVLSESKNIGNRFLSELRDTDVQQDRMRFRRNLERLGEILAYEMSRQLSYQAIDVNTPLGVKTMSLPSTDPVIVGILRAGVPFLQGFMNYFDRADVGFVGAYRKEDGPELSVNIDYLSVPSLEGRPVILIDPMLATGRSVVDAVNALIPKGKPSHLFIASVVSAPEGIKRVTEEVSLPFSLWTCAIDDKLNDSAYIVPGLGDAGDLSYGMRAL